MRLRRHHLFLLKELVKRDFQGRYAGSLLSFLWSFVQPLWLLGLYTFVFSVVLTLRIEQYDVGTYSFGIFLFCGILPWLAISEGLMRSATAVTDNSELVKKLHFPSEILILSVILGALLHEAIGIGIFVVVLAVLGELAWGSLPWLVVALPLQIALTLGLGLFLASTHVFFRDTIQVLGMVLTGWFFLTPIVYPLEMVPEELVPWIEINPLTALVDLYRRAFLGGGAEVLDAATVGLVASSAALLTAGLWLFRRLEPTFVDEI